MKPLAGLLLKEPGSGFVRDTLKLGAGMALAQTVMLAVLPLWSRLYGPADFGRYGVWTAVAGIAAILLTLRLDSCIVIASDDAQANALVRLCLWLALGGGAVLALAAWAVPASWRAGIGAATLGDWLPLAVLGGALTAIVATLQHAANRQRAYWRMSLSRIALALAAALVGSVLGAAGVASGLLVAALVGSLASWGVLAGTSGTGAPRPRVAEMAQAVRAHADAPRYLWPSALLDVVTQQLPLLLIVAWYSQEVAGQFSLAWRVLALPLFMVAGAASSVFYQRMAALAQQPQQARVLLLHTWRLFALLGALPALLVALWGAELFALLFGAPWRPAGRMAEILMPLLWVMFVSSPTSTSLIVLGLQKWSPLFGLALLACRPLAFCLGARFGSIEAGLQAWVLAEIAVIVLYNLLILRCLGHRGR